MQVRTFARRIAHQEGIKPISNVLLEYIIWERTGFPHFWISDPPIQCFENQLRQALQKIKSGLAASWE